MEPQGRLAEPRLVCHCLQMDTKLTDALGRNNLVLWTRDGKHYAVTDRHGHEAGTEHHVSEHDFDELKKLGAKVEHAPHETNG